MNGLIKLFTDCLPPFNTRNTSSTLTHTSNVLETATTTTNNPLVVEDVNAKDDYGRTPLHWAAYEKNLEIIQLLIEKGADVNAIDNDGNTPLQSAVNSGNLEIAKLLLKHGAEVNAIDIRGRTPLHRAIIKGHLATAQLLIANGADVTAKDKYGYTPFDRAVQSGNLELAKLLEIVNHLDNNDSIDELTSDIEHLTLEQIKYYYNTDQKNIDSLMKLRKDSQLALSIVHDPNKVVLHPNLNEARVINRVLVLMKVNKRLRYLHTLYSFPVKKNSQWNFYDFWKELQFFSLQDLGKLALVNREFYENLSLIKKDDVIQTLITVNQEAKAKDVATHI